MARRSSEVRQIDTGDFMLRKEYDSVATRA